MSQVLCAVDERRASAEAVRAAIDFCHQNDADLTFVGVVRPMRAVVQPAHGELVRRFSEVEDGVIAAARAARARGLSAAIVYRAGDPATELVHEAHEAGAEEIFLANAPSRLRAALSGDDAQATVTRVSVPSRRLAKTPLRAVA